MAPCTYSLERKTEGWCLQSFTVSIYMYCLYYYNFIVTFHSEFLKGYIDASIMESHAVPYPYIAASTLILHETYVSLIYKVELPST